MEEEVQNGNLSTMVLAAITLLIPIVGFVMTLSHARAGETRSEQRWRKRHGLLFWVLLPGAAGAMVLMGFAEILPKIFSIIGIVLLALGATLSHTMTRRHETGA